MKVETLRSASMQVITYCTWALAGSSIAAMTPEPTCLKGKQAELVRASGLIEGLIKAFQGPHCGSVAKVLAQLQSAKVPGGRKLHEGKPLNRQAAQQELNSARSGSEFMRKLEAASDGVTDPIARMVVEAALLDEEGYFSARQWVMEEIAAAQEKR